MPILVLLLIAFAAGLLIGLAFDRFAPAQGATAAAAEAVEHAVESHAPRTWWRARTDPAVATGLALTAAVAMVIVGGESGFRARPMEETWVVEIRQQCRRARVPFFFKQWGGVNKKKTGRVLDGRTWDEMPVTRRASYIVRSGRVELPQSYDHQNLNLNRPESPTRNLRRGGANCHTRSRSATLRHGQVGEDVGEGGSGVGVWHEADFGVR